MIIALDYDKTYTADKALWDKFIIIARESGHKVICPTLRHKEELEGVDINIEVIPTGRMAKRDVLDSMGIKVDIWIDDKPDFICEDHPFADWG